jgi:hypothetical protein
MRSRILPGMIAGVVAGIVFGVMMQVMSAPTPDGGTMPMMAMVAMVVGSRATGAPRPDALPSLRQRRAGGAEERI